MKPRGRALVFAAGFAVACAGRWIEPQSRELRDRYPRDIRVVLQNDSVVFLHEALLLGDTLIGAASYDRDAAETGRPRAIALAEVQSLARWQSSGERVMGGSLVALIGALAALA